MADTSSHLENMGRELKCPICLSLVDCAMSLTCNHVFCNLCIHKSMKSGSNCPVCKVPFRRREIRPAPHMDSLVNIYKCMKVDSRSPLFVSQDESTSQSAAKTQTNGDIDPSKKKTDEETSKRSKSKSKNSSRKQGTSSFSMNKRIQVPQSPSTETPLREAKEEHDKKQLRINVMDNRVAPSSEHPLSIGKESPGLAPFFWLRDDDEEKSTQETNEDMFTCTPVNVPSFSDIKDSDDDMPTEVSPKAPIRKCVNVELFDSEMFEWTQRPCSPELCPSPSKLQVEERDTYHDVTDKEVTAEQLDNLNPQDNDNNTYHRSSNHPRKKAKIASKRDIKGSKGNQNKRQKINVDESRETHGCSNSTNVELELGQKSENKSSPGSSKSGGASKSRSFQSPEILLSTKAIELAVPKLPASLGSEKGTKEVDTLGTATRNPKRVKKSHESKKKQRLTKADDNDIVISSRDKRCGKSTPLFNSFHEELIGKPIGGPESSSAEKKRHSQQIKATVAERICADNHLQEKMDDGCKDALAIATFPTLRKCNASSTKCAFCLTTEETEASGEMFHYAQGKPVPATHIGGSVIHSHKNCAEWAPNVYFEDDTAVNLEEELARSRRIKCSLCGVKGAALGCYEKRCNRSFHVPCAKKLRECRWDTDHFVILCPLHVSSKLPSEMSISQVPQVKNRRCNLNGKFLDQQPELPVKCSYSSWSSGKPSEKIVLCGSALTNDEKEAVSEFAKFSGLALLAQWNPTVTHVIASTIESGACKRTLKVLKGILEGKWILSIKWVQACMKASKLVEETPFEIRCDIYGIKSGPNLGRVRLHNKQPKLFSGLKFYFTGDFQSSYMSYLQDLTTTAGGTILHRKPIAEDSSSATRTLIIYAEKPEKCHPSRKDLTLKRRRSDAQALASSSGASVAHDTWLFNSIAGHKVLPF